MTSNEPVKNECEVIYEMFHILNCGMFLALIFSGYFNDFCLFEVERRFHV